LKRTYEAMLLLDNREVRKGWQPLKEQVCGLFTKHGAEIKSARRWDERRLAYPINRQLRGTYLLVYFDSPTSALTGIRRDLEFAEVVLRHLTQAVAAVPETALEPEAAFDESAVRVEDITSRREAALAEREATSRARAERDSAGDKEAAASEPADASEGEAAPEASDDSKGGE